MGPGARKVASRARRGVVNAEEKEHERVPIETITLPPEMTFVGAAPPAPADASLEALLESAVSLRHVG